MANHFPTTADGLVLSREAAAVGLHAPLLTAYHAHQLVPVRRGVYLPRDEVSALTPLALYRARVLAVGHQRLTPVFAGFSAAVLWGLPVVGEVPPFVFVVSGGTSGRRRNGVVEFARRDALLLDEHDGWALTSLADTLVDVARTMPLTTALVMVDAALHVGRFGDVAALCSKQDLVDAYERRLPFPGSARVKAVFDRGTSDADSPFETVSRVQIEALGFPEPVLQYPVVLPRSRRTVYLDTAWPEFGVWGEADGEGKYLGASMDAGDIRSPAVIVIEEKKREDEVRAATRWTPARWDWADARHPSRLRAILLEAGLPVTRRPRRMG